MRILFGRCFGLGNAIMCIPAIKALRSAGHDVDVLVGSTPDDAGALAVLRHLHESRTIERLFVDHAIGDSGPMTYDLAIMSIPFDGRWKNGVDFIAKMVMDGRTRPDPSTTGLVSWKKHEVEYQMDNAYGLGYSGEVPSCSFLPAKRGGFIRDIYLGVGYKKDKDGFWSQKHWGNENFAQFVCMVLDKYKDAHVWSTGDMLDLKLSLLPIQRMVSNSRFVIDVTGFEESFERMKRCGFYVGNDTGMMHVAASLQIPCVAYFNLENSEVKSRPWGVDNTVLSTEVFKEGVSPDVMFDCVEDYIGRL